MANNNSNQSKKQQKADLVGHTKYGNTLPDIPFDLKSMNMPFSINRYIKYKPTSLERSFKFDTHVNTDMGLTVSLVDKDKYKVDPSAEMNPADEKLLLDDILPLPDSERSRHHAKSVSWLRRSEYISTEVTRFQPLTMDKVEAKVGFNIKKNFKEEILYMDRDSQLKAIEKTFIDSTKPIFKHYSKPNVYAIQILDVFPDFENWKYPCAQVVFDDNPAPVDKPEPEQTEIMSRALIRGFMDETGNQFVAYFLPTEETNAKRSEDIAAFRQYDEDYEYEYRIAKEYNWSVKSKIIDGYEENYFLSVRPDGVFYNELETRVRLIKNRQKIGLSNNNANTKLLVRHIPINEQDQRIFNSREKYVQHYNEEEEEDDEIIALEAEKTVIENEEQKSSQSEARSVSDNSKNGIGTKRTL